MYNISKERKSSQQSCLHVALSCSVPTTNSKTRERYEHHHTEARVAAGREGDVKSWRVYVAFYHSEHPGKGSVPVSQVWAQPSLRLYRPSWLHLTLRGLREASAIFRETLQQPSDTYRGLQEILHKKMSFYNWEFVDLCKTTLALSVQLCLGVQTVPHSITDVTREWRSKAHPRKTAVPIQGEKGNASM